jgi:hypothetical protein
MKVPRVSSASKKMGHPKIPKPKSFAKGVHISQKHAAPGDVAWVGPCEGQTRIVCYYDENMDPSDCRNQPC